MRSTAGAVSHRSPWKGMSAELHTGKHQLRKSGIVLTCNRYSLRSLLCRPSTVMSFQTFLKKLLGSGVLPLPSICRGPFSHPKDNVIKVGRALLSSVPFAAGRRSLHIWQPTAGNGRRDVYPHKRPLVEQWLQISVVWLLCSFTWKKSRLTYPRKRKEEVV